MRNRGFQREIEQSANTSVPGAERVGIVFVHGIGQQPENDAIREFGGYLLKWVREWHSANSPAPLKGTWLPLTDSVLTYGGQTTPPGRFTLQIPEHGVGPAQTWVLAEAWWAARLRAPNLGTMVGWAWVVVSRVLRRLSSSVWRNFKDEYDPNEPPRPGYERWIRVASALLLLLGYAAAQLLAVPLILLLFVLAQLPGPFERAVLTLRVFLLEQIGDFYVFLRDDVQALHIRDAVAYSIKFLVKENHCTRIVVMAHSQGAAVALDALCAVKIPEIGKVQTLVTVGGSLNNAWTLNPDASTRLRSALPGHIRWLDVWADYDPVSGGRLVREGAGSKQVGEDLHVLNTLNVITDHGGYFTNREEFLSRLAQEIDSPGDHTQSRFFPGQVEFEGWRRLRRDRVLTMVTWRLAAFGLFVYIWLQRVQPVDVLAWDGGAAWAWLGRAPVVGGMVDALNGLGAATSLGPPVADVLARVVGFGFWAAVYALYFVVLYVLVFSPWNEAEGLRSVGPDAPPTSQWTAVIVTTALVVFGLVAGALVIADLPPLPLPPPKGP